MDRARLMTTGGLLMLLFSGLARAEPASSLVPPPSAPPSIATAPAPVPSSSGPLAAAPAVSVSPPAVSPAAVPSPALLRYAHERKSPGLALTLEALCPIAGAGSLYTGTEGDKAGFLAILSTLGAGAAVGSVLWLIHLDGEHTSGVSRAALDLEQSAAISVLATAGVVYLLARVSGLALASESTDAFNLDLQRRLAAP